MARSNYEITRDNMQIKFLEYDQEHMVKKFGLRYDSQYLYLPFVGRDYRIGRKNGKVEWSEDNFLHAGPAGFNEALSIYDVLCCSKEHCRLSGQFCTVNQLKGIIQSCRVGGGLFQPVARFFNGRTVQLDRACAALGGQREALGDVAYRLYPFPFFPIILRFWAADEDFPPNLTILWDENTLDFVHYETTYYIQGHLLDRLRTLMDQMDP